MCVAKMVSQCSSANFLVEIPVNNNFRSSSKPLSALFEQRCPEYFPQTDASVTAAALGKAYADVQILDDGHVNKEDKREIEKCHQEEDDEFEPLASFEEANELLQLSELVEGEVFV